MTSREWSKVEIKTVQRNVEELSIDSNYKPQSHRRLCAAGGEQATPSDS